MDDDKAAVLHMLQPFSDFTLSTVQGRTENIFMTVSQTESEGKLIIQTLCDRCDVFP